MNSHLSALIARFSSLQILVVGEAMLDSYLEGTANRLCPEAPVPAVALTGRVDAPGGAANTAANVAALGGQVTLLSAIGDDPEGAMLQHVLRERGVSADALIIHAGRRTLAKQRVVADGQILLRFDQGSTAPLDPATELQLIERLQQLALRCDAILISDYGYGILTPQVLNTLARLQARSPRLLVVDAKDLRAYQEVGITVAKPNYSQAARLLGIDAALTGSARTEAVIAHAGQILAATGARIAAVTLDADGALLCENGQPPYRTYARPAHHAQAAGAGDTFAAALTLALAVDGQNAAAAEIASAAASLVVGKSGTSCCSAQDLREQLLTEEKCVPDFGAIAARAESYRRQGRRIVFTNGCFDILHRGHITYLNQAKALGDVLIVGMNSDASVRLLKGPARPINVLEDRTQVLAAMSCVDHIIAFDQETPVELVRAIRPDVYVKGGDYTRSMLPEAAVVEEYGGTVTILEYVEARSTTGIIERIRETDGLPRGDAIPVLSDQARA